MEKHPADYPINKEQFHLLEELVATPSWLRQDNSELLILDTLEELLSKSTSEVFRVDPHKKDALKRRAVVAERGTLKDPTFTLMLYAHVDTVYPDRFPTEWRDPLTLKRDGDRLRGLGAYDMKAGVMEVIDIFRTVDVPEGIKLQAAFAHDEEMESYGALSLIKWLDERRKVPDLILSPEIATLAKRQESDSPKDVIANRIGHVKSLFEIIVPQAHRFDRSALDAEEEYIFARTHLAACFKRDVRFHKHFGKRGEDLKFHNDYSHPTGGFSNTTKAAFQMSYLNVPGHSVREVLEWEQQCLNECAKIRGWTHDRATVVFQKTPWATSYSSYALELQSALEEQVLKSVDDVYGGHKLKGGGSPSDANIFQMAFPHVPCFDIGPVGGGAHSREEWVSAQSIAKNMQWIRHVIQNALPEYLAEK